MPLPPHYYVYPNNPNPDPRWEGVCGACRLPAGDDIHDPTKRVPRKVPHPDNILRYAEPGTVEKMYE